MTVKGLAQQWYSLLKAKSIYSWDQLKANLLVDFQGFQPAGPHRHRSHYYRNHFQRHPLFNQRRFT
jgi:hypothetical protein